MPEFEILVLGMARSGKTAIARRLAHVLGAKEGDMSMETVPTTGVDIDHVMLSGIGEEGEVKVTLREVGAAMVPLWSSFVPHTDALLFAIDLSQPSQLAGAATELLEVLRNPKWHRDDGSAQPVVLVFTKSDVPSPRITMELASEVLHLPELAIALEEGPAKVPAGPFGTVPPARDTPPAKHSDLPRLSIIQCSSASGAGFAELADWVRAATAEHISL